MTNLNTSISFSMSKKRRYVIGRYLFHALYSSQLAKLRGRTKNDDLKNRTQVGGILTIFGHRNNRYLLHPSWCIDNFKCIEMH